MKILPTIQIINETTRKIIPLASNDSMGTSDLHKIVKIGEKSRSDNVFRPINSIRRRSTKLIYG